MNFLQIIIAQTKAELLILCLFCATCLTKLKPYLTKLQNLKSICENNNNCLGVILDLFFIEIRRHSWLPFLRRFLWATKAFSRPSTQSRCLFAAQELRRRTIRFLEIVLLE
jgi:hypothetical protein